jgi:hypothetical protein
MESNHKLKASMLTLPELSGPSLAAGFNYKSMNPNFDDFVVLTEARRVFLTMNGN